MTKYILLTFSSLLLFACGHQTTEQNTVKDSTSADIVPVEIPQNTQNDQMLLIDSIAFIPLSQEAEEYKNTILSDENLMNMEQKETIIKYDLASLFTQTPSHQIFGIIGDNYQRIRIKFANVMKDPKTPDTYKVIGLTKVNNNICNFDGTMKVITARQYLENDIESDTIREGFIMFEYYFAEISQQKGSGYFRGVAVARYYINMHGKLLYDDLMSGADGFNNNQFVGVWKGYNATSAKRCNWGDHRIPNSRDFDMGAGEFYPSKEYKNNGWDEYRKAYFDSPSEENVQNEQAEWWTDL